MGTHRGRVGFRGVSADLVALVVAVLVLIAAAAAWIGLRGHISRETTKQAQSCPAGRRELVVATDPDVATALTAFLGEFEKSRRVIYDYCYTFRLDYPTLEPEIEHHESRAPALWVTKDPTVAAPSSVEGAPVPIATFDCADKRFEYSAVGLNGPGISEADHRAARQFTDAARDWFAGQTIRCSG